MNKDGSFISKMMSQEDLQATWMAMHQLMNNSSLVLSGGLFLHILTDSFSPSHAKRRVSHNAKRADNLNEPHFFRDIILSTYPDFDYFKPENGFDEDNFKSEVSKYKTCKIDDAPSIPITKPDVVKNFLNILQTSYIDELYYWDKLLNLYIDLNISGDRIVRSILAVISRDKTISPDDEFYIFEDGHSIKKDELLKLREFTIQPFLIGIWRFILCNRKNNSEGKDTINKLKEKKANNVPLTYQLGESSSFNEIKVHRKEMPQVAGMNLGSLRSLSSPQNRIKELEKHSDLMATAAEKTNELICLSDKDFNEYFLKIIETYSKVKTLLYHSQPKPLYDFFVCNDLLCDNPRKIPYFIKDADITRLQCQSNFIIISGSGGYGKSMLMTHLLLQAVEDYTTTKQVPIFLPLKDYDDTFDSLLEFVFYKFDILHGHKSEEEFIEILESGCFVILCDGLDEISSDIRLKFEQKLEDFCNKYSRNTFILSSRPYDNFIKLQRFTVFQIRPFNQQQALRLVDNLEFDDNVKKDFKDALKDRLFETHKDFTENPLLLTIMFMVFDKYADVPNEMYRFYERAYEVLTIEHDHNKNGYVRKLETGLKHDTFKEFFTEFCAMSYLKEKIDISKHDAETIVKHIYNKFKAKGNDMSPISVNDFMTDLCYSMCLMYYQDDKYHFMHRSFQEYFTALFFSEQTDDYLLRIAKFFESRKGRSTDETFEMLYAMRKNAVEKEVFIPFLEDLLYDNKTGMLKGYWNFLRVIYQCIYYSRGDVEPSHTVPDSYIYNFIIKTYGLKQYANADIIDEGYDYDFIIEEFYYIDDYDVIQDEDGNNIVQPREGSLLVPLNDIPDDYSDYIDEEPTEAGTTNVIEIDRLLADEALYCGVMESLESDEFGLKKEYGDVISFLESLKTKYSNNGNTSDLLQLFFDE